MTLLTTSAKDRLIAERDDLTHARIPAAYDMIVEANDAGDNSENTDMHFAQETHAQLVKRRDEIERLLAGASVVETGAPDIVGPGTVVVIDFGDGSPEEYVFGSIEERLPGLDVMTPESPIGGVLTGASAGDVLTVPTPSGEMQVTVVTVRTAA